MKHPKRLILFLVAGCLLFAGAYRQLPLFSSNQNTYFLHGLARAGYGYLSSDWLAQQTDHVVVFSSFVSLIHLYGWPWVFYGLQAVLAAIYIGSLYGIARRVFPTDSHFLWSGLFLAFMTLIHSPWIVSRFANDGSLLGEAISELVVMADLSTNGLAGQYILGPYLQPSAFGVLLIASIAMFLWEKELLAVISAAVAATLHPTYLTHAGLLIGIYMLLLALRGSARKALSIGVLALVLLLPIGLYVVFVLRPTSSAVLSQAEAILVEERIPHHALVSAWFSRNALKQLGLMVIGLLLAYRSKSLFAILSISAAGALVVSLIQIYSVSTFLALLFPWRVSTWLVPISTALVVGFISLKAVAIMRRIPAERSRFNAGALITLLSIMYLASAFAVGVRETTTSALSNDNPETVTSFARDHSSPEQTYLVPLGFEQFRLSTGIPIFVDWKSHPYRDVEVVEWYKRVQLAKAFYEAANSDLAAEALTNIQKNDPITHIVIEKDSVSFAPLADFRLVYEDETVALYELTEHIEGQ